MTRRYWVPVVAAEKLVTDHRKELRNFGTVAVVVAAVESFGLPMS